MLACAPESSARSLQGALRFRAGVDGGGVTRLVEVSRSAPLHVQRPLFVDPERPGLATVNVINATAGLFEEDALSLYVDVMPCASVELRTPAMTRVYAMSDAGLATNALEVRVGRGGYVECMPAPTILCAGAALRQETRVDLAHAAHAAIGEVWSFGRAAHGELHAYRELHARTEVRRDGALILAEALVMRPADGLADAAAGGYAAYGSLTLVGPHVDRALLSWIRDQLGATGRILGGASMLVGDMGIAVRVLGDAPYSVYAALLSIVREFRRLWGTLSPLEVEAIGSCSTAIGGAR